MLGNKPPYTTMQQLNLDWILSKLKTLLRLVPDDGAAGQILRRTRDGAVWSDEQGGGGGAVQSVNGKTGAVVLDADDVGALPDDYTPPVTSVNGQTGAVVIPTGGNVDSVNGKTGAVVLDADDVGALPDDYTPPVTSVNGQTGAVVISTGGTPLDAYPVGSIYMSVNSTSPATLFGGTWEQLEDRFLLAAGSTYSAGSTGGSSTMDHTHTVSHTHNLDSNGYAKLTLHASGGTSIRYIGGVSTWTTNYRITGGGGSGSDFSANITEGTELGGRTGGSSAANTGAASNTNNMPPYLAVYMWKRTA